MAKKQDIKIIERTYTVPLRKEFQKVPRHKKTNKAVTAMKQFLSKHMKSADVRLGKSINEEIWKHGIQNPPHHVKVTVTKDPEGVVNAELFGLKETTKKTEPKKPVVKKEESKPEVKAEPKKEEVKVEEPKEEVKAEVKPVEAEMLKEEEKAEVKPEAAPKAE
jgi:large subunit ribosomal protein L31e